MSIQAINSRLQELVSECREERLREAMSYSLLASGKRMRPMLLLAAAEAVSGSYDDTALDFACAIEMIHNYSLIHDDLPSMDNDELRRGKPTCHIVYGEALAILAGDALLNHAAEVMARRAAAARSARPAKAMWVIMHAAGVNGMIAGQVLDCEWEHKKADESTLLNIQANKTKALIAASTEAGAILGGGTPAMVKKIKFIGECLGQAFQIKDDILDMTATTDELGKPAGSDEKNNKNTYVSVFGMERAVADLKKYSDEAHTYLRELKLKSNALLTSVESINTRKK